MRKITTPRPDAMVMQIGTAEARSGRLMEGWLAVTKLLTGVTERLSVLIADGVADGPTL